MIVQQLNLGDNQTPELAPSSNRDLQSDLKRKDISIGRLDSDGGESTSKDK